MFNLARSAIEHAVQNYEIDYRSQYGSLFSNEVINNFRRAAVMIPMLQIEHQWHLLLTRRSETLEEHRGQVAFPGGAQELQDQNLQQTALREMKEEIGVQPTDVHVFGHLGDMPILTGYLVRPFVGEIPWPYDLNISGDEVQSAFIVPLKWLANPKNRQAEYRSYGGREIPVVFYDTYKGHQLWGASAEMTLALLAALEHVIPS